MALWNEKIWKKDYGDKALARRLYNKLLNKYSRLSENPEFLKENCQEKMIPPNPNPDVEELIKSSKEQLVVDLVCLRSWYLNTELVLEQATICLNEMRSRLMAISMPKWGWPIIMRISQESLPSPLEYSKAF